MFNKTQNFLYSALAPVQKYLNFCTGARAQLYAENLIMSQPTISDKKPTVLELQPGVYSGYLGKITRGWVESMEDMTLRTSPERAGRAGF